MSTLQNITETQHNELLTLLNPLVDFMTENGFSYFLVAGKDGTCTRHMRGQLIDVAGMIRGMMENNTCVREIIEHCNETL
jgi:hypothetical protein